MTNNHPAPTVNIHARSVDVDAKWLEHVRERTLDLDRFGNRILNIDVEFSHNRNPSRQAASWHTEISTRVNGHTLIARADAADPARSFELAREKMESNLRRAARRFQWSRHGRKATITMRESLA